MAPLLLPYLSDKISGDIRRYIKQHKLDIRPIFIPGKTLGQQFCRSRPLDVRKCALANPDLCKICPHIENGGCGKRNIVYKVLCLLCIIKFYIGETYRQGHGRFGEHFRAAIHPSKYPGNSIGKHYDTYHKGQMPALKFFILDVQSDNVKRKISEALFIKSEKPDINSRDEMVEAMKFLAKFDEN